MIKVLKYCLPLLVLLMFNSCHKYPNGGWTTNAVRHLWGGGIFSEGKRWSVTKYVVNNIDSTDFVNGRSSNSYSLGTFTFARDFMDKTIGTSTSIRYTYNLSFSDSRRSLLTEKSATKECNTTRCEYDVLNPLKTTDGVTIWKIRQLTSTKLVLSYLNQSIYELTLSTE